METTEFVRKSFTVKAVEVTFENYLEVASWCKGTVELETTRMLGTETKLPVVKLKGQGDNRGKEFTATLGCYIVELKGSFRVYKQAQFFSAFEEKVVLEEPKKDKYLPGHLSDGSCCPDKGEDGVTSLGNLHFVDIRSGNEAS